MPWPRNVPDALPERKAKVSNAAAGAAAAQSVSLGAESDVDAAVNRKAVIWLDQ